MDASYLCSERRDINRRWPEQNAKVNLHPSFQLPPGALLPHNIQIPNGFDDRLCCYPVFWTQNALARVRGLPELKCQTRHARGFQGWVPVRPVLFRFDRHLFIPSLRHVDSAQMYGNEAQVADAVRASGLDRGDVFISAYILVLSLNAQVELRNSIYV